MKTKTILVILLLMTFSLIFASEDSTEAEHWEKVRQMDQLAERFKAETGFDGKIESLAEQMTLSRFTGNFIDINMTNVRDSVSFRQVCTSVINKLLPYIEAKNEQLVPGRINVGSDQISTRYYQIVNGYKVESGGYLNIYFLYDQKRFGILNVTVDIPPHKLGRIISEDEAKDIVIDYHMNKYNISNKEWGEFIVVDLEYSKVGATEYKLMYLVTLDDITYYLDAITCHIYGAHSYVDNLTSIVSVRGRVYSPSITSLTPIVYSDSLAMQGIEVEFNNIHDHTNGYGTVAFPDSILTSYEVLLASEAFRICDSADSLNTLTTSEYTLLSNTFETLIGDWCAVNGSMKLCYAPNIYTHADAQIAFQKRANPDYNADMKIITNFQFLNPNTSGQISYQQNIIRLETGLIPNYITHEFGHHFVWNALNTTFAPGTDFKAMDEAFAHYLSCASVQWSKLIFPNQSNSFIFDLSLPVLIDVWANNLGEINENKYGCYLAGLNIASAWWSLRSNSAFGSDPSPGLKAFDDLLVSTLKQGVNSNDSQRYKPRYFYNILMSRVEDNNSTSWPLNDKQLAINKAYNDRGFHFYPTVESIACSTNPIALNFYNPGDSVYVHIKNCPQNTKVGVRIVANDNTYDQIGAAGRAIPTAVSVFSNSVYREVTTNENGEWKGSIYNSNLLLPGEYDIIVDVGSPTAPDNMLNLVFAKDNIIDAVDGLDGAGFIVTNLGDAVVALDLSSKEFKHLQQPTWLTDNLKLNSK